jgi:hypothetical protein
MGSGLGVRAEGYRIDSRLNQNCLKSKLFKIKIV